MAKYLVKSGFRDIHTGENYSAGQEIDMTVKRAKEAEKNLASKVKELANLGSLTSEQVEKYESGFLERVEE